MALAILAPGHGHDQRSRGQNARRVVLPSLVQDRLRECGLEKVDLTAPKPVHAGTVDCWGIVKVGSGQASSGPLTAWTEEERCFANHYFNAEGPSHFRLFSLQVMRRLFFKAEARLNARSNVRQHTGTWAPGSLDVTEMITCSGVSRREFLDTLEVSVEEFNAFCKEPCGFLVPTPLLELMLRGGWSTIMVNAGWVNPFWPSRQVQPLQKIISKLGFPCPSWVEQRAEQERPLEAKIHMTIAMSGTPAQTKTCKRRVMSGAPAQTKPRTSPPSRVLSGILPKAQLLGSRAMSALAKASPEAEAGSSKVEGPRGGAGIGRKKMYGRMRSGPKAGHGNTGPLSLAGPICTKVVRQARDTREEARRPESGGPSAVIIAARQAGRKQKPQLRWQNLQRVRRMQKKKLPNQSRRWQNLIHLRRMQKKNLPSRHWQSLQ